MTSEILRYIRKEQWYSVTQIFLRNARAGGTENIATIRYWCREGKLKAERAPNHYQVKGSDIYFFIKNRKNRKTIGDINNGKAR